MQAGPAPVTLTGKGAAGRAGYGAGIIGVGLALSACAAAPQQPMSMPPADGRAEQVQLNSHRYDVGRRDMAAAPGRMVLRVTRTGGPDLDYSDGLTAKAVASAYCGQYNRVLNPGAYGMFSAPASWIFEEGCQ